MSNKPEFTAESQSDSKAVPKRVAFIKYQTSALVKHEDEDLVMTFPDLVVRGVIAFQVMVIILAGLSLAFDAPLEWIANPEHTPNPAKAPWYFVGLQELLHYFPPVVGGVLIPALVVIALVVIPYFDINLKREGLWADNPRRTLAVLTSFAVLFSGIMAWFHAYAIAGPTLLLYGVALIPYFSGREDGVVGWLRQLPLSGWVMTWFILLATTLTIIGQVFRGPSWRWVWPWIEGIYH